MDAVRVDRSAVARTRIGITLGDPRGVGPEVTEKAIQRLRQAAPPIELTAIGPGSLSGLPGVDRFIDVGDWRPGDVTSAGRVAGLAIERAASLALQHELDALVTAPIDKAALHLSGYHFPGHTEMLAQLTNSVSVAMMMCAETTRLGGALRVVLATTHMPLSHVPSYLTTGLLVQQARLTQTALREFWNFSAPRVALCALNPHASDGGLFGDEETRVFGPALEQLWTEGMTVAGPIPADTVFVRALSGEFDAVIAPYHDVGMASFKTASFGKGVNVTLGLPFVRTSPDHGTALDIAGTGRADPSSMVAALELALRLAQTQKHAFAPVR